MTALNVTVGDFVPLFGGLGAVFAIFLTSLGAAIGTAKTAAAISSIAAKRVDLIYKSMIPIVMSGVLSIYGIIVAVIIVNNLTSDPSVYRSVMSMCGGLAVGLTSLSSGTAIGVVAAHGVPALAEQSKSYVQMIMTLIFAEALGLYGLIVSLLLCIL